MSRNLISEPMLNAITLDDELTNYTPWLDVHDMGRFSILFTAAKTSTPGDVTFVVEASPDSAAALNSGLLSAPTALITPVSVLAALTAVTSKVFSANGNAVLSKIGTDAFRSIRLKYSAAATTDATKTWALSAWLVGASGD
jgi:hypothetical protein